MAGGLDMSLDDLIKSNRKPTGSRGRGNGGSSRFGGGSGPSRRFSNRAGNRTAPYSRPLQQQQAQDPMWQNDVFATDESVAAAFGHQSGGFGSVVGGSSIETGTKLYISNLDYGVSNEDIKELFSEVGDLKRYGLHYDKSGRSKGTAEVVFSRRGDALAAVKRYNNVQLDGKLMKIEIVGTNLSAPTPTTPLAPVQFPFPSNGILGNFNDNYNGGFNGNFNGNFRFEEVVLWGGLVVVLAVVISEVVEEAGEVEEAVMKRYLQRILMLNWTSITKQQWKQAKRSDEVHRNVFL
ncbi:hypothetical protein HID58_089980 [Brassica napus]|uniref:RRM domain-containing protein n=1 Tax=Brassica napus TaxID=3708 RepID=A0ABQ7Y1X5_BRANA|nr:hypothetical protein HID58_089980 [Brassica napus]